MSTLDQLKAWRSTVRDVADKQKLDYYYGRLTGIDDAISIVGKVEQFDGCDGCSTGDCPHTNVNDCVKAQAKIIAEQAAQISTLTREREADKFTPTHRHFKGGLYQVIGRAKDACDYHGPQFVVYRQESGDMWIRRAREFDETFVDPSISDKPIRRFEPLQPEPRHP